MPDSRSAVKRGTRTPPPGSALAQAEAVAAEAADADWVLLRLGAFGSVTAYRETFDRQRLHHRLLIAIDVLWHDSALIACAAGCCDCHARGGVA